MVQIKIGSHNELITLGAKAIGINPLWPKTLGAKKLGLVNFKQESMEVK